MELKNAKINFLGDSITEGHGVDPQECFVSLIGAKYGAVCRNYGIGGTRIARQRVPSAEAKWDKDFCSRYDTMDPDADIAVVFGGTNDFGHGDARLGKPEDTDLYSFCGALEYLYSGLARRYPLSWIVVMTPLHRYDETWPVCPSGFTRTFPMTDYVEAIRKAAERYSFPVLDLYAASGLQPAVQEIGDRFFLDGLHPNTDGHLLLSEQVGSFLSSLPERRRLLR